MGIRIRSPLVTFENVAGAAPSFRRPEFPGLWIMYVASKCASRVSRRIRLKWCTRGRALENEPVPSDSIRVSAMTTLVDLAFSGRVPASALLCRSVWSAPSGVGRLKRTITERSSRISIYSRPRAAIRGLLALTLLFLAATIFIGCSRLSEQERSTEEPEVTTACPAPTRLVRGGPNDPYPAARIGRLWFTGLGAGPQARILLVPGLPTKVPISVVRPLDRSLTLRGSLCGDNKPLRFWYRDRGWYGEREPFQVPMSRAAMSDEGDLIAELRARPTTWSYAGYMLFTSPGRWRIEVRKGSNLIGTLILEVMSPAEDSAFAQPPPVPLMPTPPSALQKCRRSRLLHQACPRRIPRVEGWSAFASDGRTPIFSLERGGEDPEHPERNRPPNMLHLVVHGASGGPSPLPRSAVHAVEPMNGLVRLGRLDPVFLGSARWGGRAGTLVLAPPYPFAGMDSNHLIFSWEQDGRCGSRSSNAWPAFGR